MRDNHANAVRGRLNYAPIRNGVCPLNDANSRERNYTQGKIERREREIEENIQRYLDALETADRTQPVELQAKTDRLQDKITKLRQKMKDLQEIKVQLQAQPDGQISLTDPDARAMTTHSMKGTALVGYNV